MRPQCTIDGCASPARSKSAQWCSKHYHRWYRHGDPNKTATGTAVSVSHGRRYRLVYRPSHPLAARRGMAWEHRIVLYDTIGPGPHKCHWCATEIDWLPKSDPRHIEADHINGIGDDNHPENLVAACHPCNVTRSSHQRATALRGAGWWARKDTEIRRRLA